MFNRLFDQEYVFDWAKEAFYGVLTVAAVATTPLILQLLDRDLEEVLLWGGDDWKSYGMLVAASLWRVVPAAIVNQVRKLFITAA